MSEGKTLAAFSSVTRVVAVYLASESGFQNYCEGCVACALVQDVGGKVIRVFCAAEKCAKPAV